MSINLPDLGVMNVVAQGINPQGMITGQGLDVLDLADMGQATSDSLKQVAEAATGAGLVTGIVVGVAGTLLVQWWRSRTS